MIWSDDPDLHFSVNDMLNSFESILSILLDNRLDVIAISCVMSVDFRDVGTINDNKSEDNQET